MNSRRIKLVVFDLGGTTVDHGCLAPVVAFVEAFGRLGIEITNQQARGPMGLHKRDHIRELFKLESVSDQWREQRSRAWTEEDVQYVFETFLPMQTDIAQQYTDVVPGAIDCFAALREDGMAIGASTGYPRAVAEQVIQAAAQQGCSLDASVCADEVPAGRPAPWMIYRNMEALGIFPSTAVIKVGDTVPDMEAARNAGVWAVGVTQTSSEIGLALEEFQQRSAVEKETLHRAATDKLRASGAHATIKTLDELPDLIRTSRLLES